jgi:hypothetical protein
VILNAYDKGCRRVLSINPFSTSDLAFLIFLSISLSEGNRSKCIDHLKLEEKRREEKRREVKRREEKRREEKRREEKRRESGEIVRR